MRLDNRSQAILITGEALQDAESRDALKTYFESHGGNIEETADGGVKVQYKDRAAAEKVSPRSDRRGGIDDKVLALGTKEIPQLEGKINATWYSAAPAPSSFAPTSTQESGNEVDMAEETHRGDREEDE